MFIRKKQLYGEKIAVQICEGHRENGRVKQRVLKHVGTVAQQEHEALEQLMQASLFLKTELEQERSSRMLEIAPDLPFSSPSQQTEPHFPINEEQKEEPIWIDASQLSEESRIVEGIHAIFGSAFDKLGLWGVLGIKQHELLRQMIMARIAWPSSKLRASENLLKHFDVDLSVDRMYRCMDTLEDKEILVQKTVLNAFRPLIGEKVEVLFFDVTTLYFESASEDDLRRFGFSKDQKTHMTQLVLALATTQEGLPVGYKLFPGNTAETSTLIQAVNDWKEVFDIANITIIADRAMMSDKNMLLLEQSGMRYVIAAKLKLLPKRLQESILSRENEQTIYRTEEDVVTVQEHLYEKRRLIVSHSTKRAHKDARDREQILNKLKKTIGKESSTKKLVTNRGYLSVITESGSSTIKIDENKVAAAIRWDGLHGVLTNIPNISHQEILGLYKRLWVIEESFRINKHTLEMRPVYHHASRRIKAHILLCYITFAVCRYVQKRIAMQYENLSIDRIRNILIDVQYSVLRDGKTESKYCLPSKMSMEARQIYSVFSLKRDKRLTKMLCLNKKMEY